MFDFLNLKKKIFSTDFRSARYIQMRAIYAKLWYMQQSHLEYNKYTSAK